MIDGSNYWDIDGCIKYIVLGDAFVKSKSHISKLKRYIRNLKMTYSNRIDMYSFAQSIHSDHGYIDLSITYKFI